MMLVTLVASAQKTYKNPVLPHDCPDPTVLDDRARSGWFYLYSTQTNISGIVNRDASSADASSKTVNLPIYRSKDLVDWEFVGDGFPDGKPSWVKNAGLWAPDINYVNGHYVLYYAMGVWDGLVESASGAAVSDSPLGPFIDHGEVVSYQSQQVLNSIDPNYFEDESGKYMFWGSLGGGMYGIELSDDALSVAPGAKKHLVGASNIEAAYMYKRDGWYYMFASRGACCEKENSTYHVIVGRSRNVFGPFLSPDGKELTSSEFPNVLLTAEKGGKYVGPGHNAEIITDDEGQDWFLYHSFWTENDYRGRCLNMDKLFWNEEGWPYIETGHPSAGGASPVFKK